MIDTTHWQLEDWLQWLETSHNQKIDLSLERTRTVYQRLLQHFAVDKTSDSQFSVRQLAKQIITVAGTNGKGSTIGSSDRNDLLG